MFASFRLLLSEFCSTTLFEKEISFNARGKLQRARHWGGGGEGEEARPLLHGPGLPSSHSPPSALSQHNVGRARGPVQWKSNLLLSPPPLLPGLTDSYRQEAGLEATLAVSWASGGGVELERRAVLANRGFTAAWLGSLFCSRLGDKLECPQPAGLGHYRQPASPTQRANICSLLTQLRVLKVRNIDCFRLKLFKCLYLTLMYQTRRRPFFYTNSVNMMLLCKIDFLKVITVCFSF